MFEMSINDTPVLFPNSDTEISAVIAVVEETLAVPGVNQRVLFARHEDPSAFTPTLLQNGIICMIRYELSEVGPGQFTGCVTIAGQSVNGLLMAMKAVMSPEQLAAGYPKLDEDAALLFCNGDRLGLGKLSPLGEFLADGMLYLPPLNPYSAPYEEALKELFTAVITVVQKGGAVTRARNAEQPPA